MIHFKKTEMFTINSITDGTLLTKEGHYESIYICHLSMPANGAIKISRIHHFQENKFQWTVSLCELSPNYL